MKTSHSEKIGFWPVIAIVVGSQIGSGVFMLPATMAPFGIFSIYGWVLASFGAMVLAVVFAYLSFLYPRTGGPHAYVKESFGFQASFFVGWTYWLISWVSSTAVIVAAIGYLTPFIGEQDGNFYLFLEIILLFFLTLLNLAGVKAAGRAEFFLSLIKFIPLVIVPIFAFNYFDINNLQLSGEYITHSDASIISHATVLALWGFIGVESATTPAGSIENPTKNIPLAILLGTSLVALVYIINSIGIMGLIEGETLVNSKAPYVDATQIMFKGQWHLIISIIASLICVGTLNAWILTSGQIALGNAEDKTFPSIFGLQNKYGAPYFALVFSAVGTVPFLILTSSDSFAEQLTKIIDISVICFLYVYLACSLACMVAVVRKAKTFSGFLLMFVTIISSVFCIWVIIGNDFNIISQSLIFPLSGIPIYLYRKLKNKNKDKT